MTGDSLAVPPGNRKVNKRPAPHLVSCRVFLEEVEIMPCLFDQFLLLSVDRTPGISQTINDGALGGFDFLQQGYWVQFEYSIVIKRLPGAAVFVRRSFFPSIIPSINKDAGLYHNY